jgi:hypothetical protein
MEIARDRDLEGYINSDKEFKFKTESGRLYTWNKTDKRWVKPTITIYWFVHNFHIVVSKYLD